MDLNKNMPDYPDLKTEGNCTADPSDQHHILKKWKAYFLEFLMIFLAVTLGFIAESIREHFVDKKHEKEYAISLVRDLQHDTSDINRVMTGLRRDISRAETMISLFEKRDFKNTSGMMYYLGRLLGLRNLWRSNDGTLQQLTYAGGLNAIGNQPIVDSIQNYTRRIKDLVQILSLEDLEIAEYRKYQSKVFSGFVFDEMIQSTNGFALKLPHGNPDLISTHQQDINDLIMQTTTVKGNRIKQLDFLQEILSKADHLIDVIQQQYHLK
jgi:hypothetical protein